MPRSLHRRNEKYASRLIELVTQIASPPMRNADSAHRFLPVFVILLFGVKNTGNYGQCWRSLRK